MGVVSPEQRIKLTPARRVVVPIFSDVGKPAMRTSRRRKKLWRFILIEAVAFVALLVAIKLGTTDGLVRAKLTAPFQIAVVVSAALMALIPVAFFGVPGRSYRRRRAR